MRVASAVYGGDRVGSENQVEWSAGGRSALIANDQAWGIARSLRVYTGARIRLKGMLDAAPALGLDTRVWARAGHARRNYPLPLGGAVLHTHRQRRGCAGLGRLPRPAADRELTTEWMGPGINESREQCVARGIPAGKHVGRVWVNEEGAIPEMDERNNLLSGRFQFAGLVFPPGGPRNAGCGQRVISGRPLSSLADLTVTGLRMRGSKRRGSDDCDPGKNDVVVSIRNQG
jgi:hypothetical protein